MRIVLNPNIVLAAVSPRSPFQSVLEAWRQRRYELCVSTEILLEYEEKLSEKFGSSLASLTVNSFLERTGTTQVAVHFTHRLITADPDDDKFVNCALWGNAHYLVTNDRHFQSLRGLEFPKLTVLTMAQFQEMLATTEPTFSRPVYVIPT